MVRVDLSEASVWLLDLNGRAHAETVGFNCECQRLGLPLHPQDQSEAHIALPARREGHRQQQPVPKSSKQYVIYSML